MINCRCLHVILRLLIGESIHECYWRDWDGWLISRLNAAPAQHVECSVGIRYRRFCKFIRLKVNQGRCRKALKESERNQPNWCRFEAVSQGNWGHWKKNSLWLVSGFPTCAQKNLIAYVSRRSESKTQINKFLSVRRPHFFSEMAGYKNFDIFTVHQPWSRTGPSF